MSYPTNTGDRLCAAYALVGELPPARTDLALPVRVRVTNTGAAPWSHRGTTPVNLSYHWLDTQGRPVDFEGLRALMPGPLRPGEAVELDLLVEPPERPGAYLLAFDMVEEGVGWFSLQGAPYHTISVTVEPAPAAGRTVCIINGNAVINDAVGNTVVNQLRMFAERGDNVLALVEHADLRQPPEVRSRIVQVTLETLQGHDTNPQTRRAVRQFASADLYVVHYSTYYHLVEAIRLIGHGVVIFDYHGVTPPQFWEGPGLEDVIEGQRRVELVRYADYGVTHSNYTRDELIATGLIPPERVYVAPLSADLRRFAPGPKPAYLLERYGLRPDQPVVLYLGRMATNKRIGVLVEALALVRQQMPDARLLLVGDTEQPSYAMNVARAQARAAELGIAGAVTFTRQIPDAELPDHYRLCDVFATASVHEGFCVPVVEAMACGRPVVGAHAAALPETIGDGGLTFAPDDPADCAASILALLWERG